KKAYLEEVTKYVKSLKFMFWGHDLTVLHSSKLRKRLDDFQFLHNQSLRFNFIEELNKVINNSPFEIIATAIDKRCLYEDVIKFSNPYELSLEYCVRDIYRFLKAKNQAHKLTHIIIESRGSKEDDDLQVAFERILHAQGDLRTLYPLKLYFAD